MDVKIWAPPERDLNSNAAHGAVLIAVLAVVITGASAVLMVIAELDKNALLALTAAVTALCVYLALRLGRRARRSTLIFCLDGERRLFVVDATLFFRAGHGAAGWASMQSDAHAAVRALCRRDGILERYMSARGSLTGLERQILSVERVDMRRTHDYLHCRVRYPNGNEGAERIMLVHGYEDEDSLRRELERLGA